MSIEIGRFTPSLQAAYAVPPARPAAAAPVDKVTLDVPSSPPPDARAQVELAAQIADEMAANNRELHFSKDEDTGRLVIQVRDLTGKVIRTIPPSHALDIMSGAQQA
jgi:FlaG protein